LLIYFVNNIIQINEGKDKAIKQRKDKWESNAVVSAYTIKIQCSILLK